MKYPNKCSRCGMCCLAEQCIISIEIYGRRDICPALSFNGSISSCKHAGLVPIGDGCCIKARAYKNNIEYDFASLPAEVKFNAVSALLKKK